MPSDQHPTTPPSHLPLDILLAVDVDVGWQVGLTTLPGQVTPTDALPLSHPDGATATFDAEYTALITNRDGVRELRDVVIGAIINRQADLGTEFFIQNFGSAFYRVVACTECAEASECPRCNKSGCVTEIFRPYLIGLCSVKGVHEPYASRASAAAIPDLPLAPPMVAPGPPLPTLPSRRPTRHWLWTVPVAALATVMMAISIGLRSMYEAEGPKRPPEAASVASPLAPVPAPVITPPTTPTPAPAAELPAPLSPAEAPAVETPPPAETAFTEPPRKPVPPAVVAAPAPPAAPAAPASAPATPSVPAAVDKNAPVARLQTALAQLTVYHGPVTGVLDVPTRQALTEFLAMVPAPVRAQYGIRMAALAEAAVRHEFALKSK